MEDFGLEDLVKAKSPFKNQKKFYIQTINNIAPSISLPILSKELRK